jgi:hypothetical protein
MLSVLYCLSCLLLIVPGAESHPDASARELVQTVVKGELAADAQDHSHWIYRDAKQVAGKSTVTLIVQTTEGAVSKIIAMDGNALTPEEQKEDEARMDRFVSDPAVRQKQKQRNQQDAQKALALTRMLPDGFLWTKTGQSGPNTTLAFRPNPHFNPPTREARVLAAMEGTMVVNAAQNRIVSLQGRLTKNVDFGLGLLGKLQKGGTFDIERREVAPKVWQITATHVHITGHAIIFKSIGEQQDEETSNYHPAPPQITLEEAAKMLNDGAAARAIGCCQ